jgi:hypothetical protein
MRCPFRHVTKLVDGVAAPHRLVAVAADGPQVVNIGRATLTLRDVMAALEIKRSNFVFTPANQALVLKVLADVNQPHLLAERLRQLELHIFE